MTISAPFFTLKLTKKIAQGPVFLLVVLLVKLHHITQIMDPRIFVLHLSFWMIPSILSRFICPLEINSLKNYADVNSTWFFYVGIGIHTCVLVTNDRPAHLCLWWPCFLDFEASFLRFYLYFLYTFIIKIMYETGISTE